MSAPAALAPPLSDEPAGLGGATPAGAPRRHLGTTIATWLAIAVLVTVAARVGVTTARGGHLFVVQTPSMGTTAPVGTLIVTEPVTGTQIEAGDIITFRPPGVDRVYTHRVLEVTDTGLRTKGDMNEAADGWIVPTDRVIGRAAHVWFGLGWLKLMLPWLVGGLLLTALVGYFSKERNRAAVAIAGSALSLSLALIMVRPLVRAQTVGFVPTGEDGVQISVVNTGLLPIRASALDDAHVDLFPGQLAWVSTYETDSHGRFQLMPTLHLPWWGWVLVALFCLSPLIAALLIREDRPDDSSAEPGADGSGTPDPGTADSAAGSGAMPGSSGSARAFGSSMAERVRGLLPERRHASWLSPRRARWVRTAGAAALSLALGLAVAPSHAALTAKINNDTNSAASRMVFSCLDAMQYYNSAPGGKELYTGFTVGSGTGQTGLSDQGTRGYNMSLSNTSVAGSVGCLSDATIRSQKAVTLNGSSSHIDLSAGSSMSDVTPDPGNLNHTTWQFWIRTTTASGGVLGCPAKPSDECGDRITWMDDSGRVNYGVGSTVISSPSALNDGNWHMVVTQLDSSRGMTMWVDGVSVARNAGTTRGGLGIRYPQWGYSSGTWDSAYNAYKPTSMYFAGDMQMLAIYGGTPMATADIQYLYDAAKA